MAENEHLRKQIKYLTDLINNANKESRKSTSDGSGTSSVTSRSSGTSSVTSRSSGTSSVTSRTYNLNSSSQMTKQNSKNLKRSQFVWKKGLSLYAGTSGQSEFTTSKLGNRNVSQIPQSDLPVSRSLAFQTHHSVQSSANSSVTKNFKNPSADDGRFTTEPVTPGERISMATPGEGISMATCNNLNKFTPKIPVDSIHRPENLTFAKSAKYKLEKSALNKSLVPMTTRDVALHMESKKAELKQSMSHKPTDSVTHVDKVSCVTDSPKSVKETKSLSSIDNQSFQFGNAASPSKKEAVDLLNHKLSVTSDKMQKLKKSLSQNIQVSQYKNEVLHGTETGKPFSVLNYKKSSDLKQAPVMKSPNLITRNSRFKYNRTNKVQDPNKVVNKLSPFSVYSQNKAQTNLYSGIQVAANVIKSKYRLRKTQVNSTSLNRTAKSHRCRINMKKFYRKMAKKYGWTDLKGSGYSLRQKRPLQDNFNRHLRKPVGKNKTVYFVNRRYNQATKLSHASRLKLDRRKFSPKPLVNRSKKGTHFVMLNGVLYKSNRTSMVKTTINKNFNTNQSFSTWRSKVKSRVHGATGRLKSDFTLIRTPTSLLRSESERRSYNARMLASKAIVRSIATATAKYRRNNTKTNVKKYCIFFNRFGKCNRGNNCPYIHDPERVAVCTRLLRGTCRVLNCPFSHKIAKEKMPVCSYFLKGVCNRDDCPYLHVNVSKDAAICQDFLEGFCSLGEKCKKKHTRVCEEFIARGTCSDGAKCKLFHVQRGKRRKKKSSSTADNIVQNQENTPDLVSGKKRDLDQQDCDNSSIPFKYRKLPTYISLDMSKSEPDDEDNAIETSSKQINVPVVRKQNDRVGIQIKPKL